LALEAAAEEEDESSCVEDSFTDEEASADEDDEEEEEEEEDTEESSGLTASLSAAISLGLSPTEGPKSTASPAFLNLPGLPIPAFFKGDSKSVVRPWDSNKEAKPASLSL